MSTPPRISIRVGRKFVPHPSMQYQPLEVSVEWSEDIPPDGSDPDEMTKHVRDHVLGLVSDTIYHATKKLYPELSKEDKAR